MMFSCPLDARICIYYIYTKDKACHCLCQSPSADKCSVQAVTKYSACLQFAHYFAACLAKRLLNDFFTYLVSKCE